MAKLETEMTVDVETEKMEELARRMEAAAEKMEHAEYAFRRWVESGYNMRWGGRDEGMPEWMKEMFFALMHGH